MFENSFPDITARAVWKRKALLEAASYVMNMPNTATRQRYPIIRDRIREDSEYTNDLSKVVRGSFLNINMN